MCIRDSTEESLLFFIRRKYNLFWTPSRSACTCCGYTWMVFDLNFTVFHTHIQENWESLVAEHEKDVLEWSACMNKDVLVLCYLHDVKVYEKQIAGLKYVFLCYRTVLLFDFFHSFMVCYELIWYMGRLVTNQQRSHFSLSSLHSCLSFGFVFMSMRSSEFWNFRTLT